MLVWFDVVVDMVNVLVVDDVVLVLYVEIV